MRILEAKERPGFQPVDWLDFPPKDLVINIVIGHGVILGKHVQVIRDCKCVTVSGCKLCILPLTNSQCTKRILMPYLKVKRNSGMR